MTAKINTDSNEWGDTAAKWLIEKLGGEGKILVLNGPAGISVSDDRRRGADAALAANPGIEILAETNTAYNVAPAQEAVTSLLFAQPEIDGILSLGGALSAGAILAMDKQGRPLVPITGENARQFLELWKEKGLKSWAMQPEAATAPSPPTPRRAQNKSPGHQGASADHRQLEHRRVPRQGQRLPGRRLHLLAVGRGALREPDRAEVGRRPRSPASARSSPPAACQSFFGNPVLRDVSIALHRDASTYSSARTGRASRPSSISCPGPSSPTGAIEADGRSLGR